MKGIGRGKSVRGGRGFGRGNFQGHGGFGATSQQEVQSRQIARTSIGTEQLNNPSQQPLPREQVSSNPLQRTSQDTQSSRNLDGSLQSSVEPENATASSTTKKRARGIYKSRTVDIKTKAGGKIVITIPEDIDRAVGAGARDIVNYSGLIMRTTVSFRDGNWEEIASKHGETMWLKVKEKFAVCSGVPEHRMQAFVLDTMRRLFRAWKARLSNYYSTFSSDEERLSKRPTTVDVDDWKYLVKLFGSKDFKAVSERNKKNREKQIIRHSCGTRSFAEIEESTRNPTSGEKLPPDEVWKRQHTHKDANGELVFLDPRSQEIHGELHKLVLQQQSEEVDHPMTRDEILSSVLGERSGYVRGKGYGKKPPRKSQTQQANIEASVSSAVETMRQEMEIDMDQKLQEEREKMNQKLLEEREQMNQKLLEEREQMRQKILEEREQMDRKMEEERALVKADLDKMIKAQMAAFMTSMQRR